MPKDQLKIMAKELRHNTKRRGCRASYDLTPEIIESIRELADKHSITNSQVVALALAMFIDRVNNDPKFLQGFLVLSTTESTRYEHRVVLPTKYR